ncbi:unnamed protein product [Adineta ricciae]|uniref:Uncharacterized protein n=1 Tax=Adineta ricciae TaxID=249248 RepID=A0A815LI67_ADIRI|nr:unnamed protein product [Adineta ricciae]
MFTVSLIICHHTKSTHFNILRTITSSAKMNIEFEMKKFNDKRQFTKALDLYDKYKHQSIITDRILVHALNACGQLGYVERGEIIHKKLSNDSLNNIYIQTSLIQFYMRCGRVNDAQCIFNESTSKTMVHYGSLMKGFKMNGMPEKAIDLFSKVTNPNEILLCLLFSSCAQVQTKKALEFGRKVWFQMPLINRKNKHILVATFDMFIKCGDISNAEKLFDMLEHVVIDYGQMMKCYNDHRLPMRTIDLYKKMKKEGIQPDKIIFVLLIDACAQIGIESRCRTIVKQIPSSMFNDLQFQTALIHMWGKVGFVKEAEQIFKQIDQPDPVAYTAMINSYGLNGLGYKAIELYYRMPVEMIVEKTHVCVLNACSHSGLVDEARFIFSTISMKNKWVYTAMVDCLSRLSLFDEAKELIEEFERHQSPCLPMYKSISHLLETLLIQD